MEARKKLLLRPSEPGWIEAQETAGPFVEDAAVGGNVEGPGSHLSRLHGQIEPVAALAQDLLRASAFGDVDGRTEEDPLSLDLHDACGEKSNEFLPVLSDAGHFEVAGG